MSWYSFRPYVSVADRRRNAAAATRKLTAKSGRAPAPILIAGRKIATTFWGKAWCDNLEAYSDYSNRLPRGRSYVRNGSVIDLQIHPGKVEALVQGSSLYKVAIGFTSLPTPRWQEFKARSAGKVTNLLDLLQGKLPQDILADITAQGTGLFPAPKEIKLDCSCPDWADMCKHVAAVLYGVGARLDDKPELFFTLRGVDMQELIGAASAAATTPLPATGAGDALAGEDLSTLFGVDLETPSAPDHPPAAPSRRPATGSPKKPATSPKKHATRRKPAQGMDRPSTQVKKPASARKPLRERSRTQRP